MRCRLIRRYRSQKQRTSSPPFSFSETQTALIQKPVRHLLLQQLLRLKSRWGRVESVAVLRRSHEY